jgi:translation initiation factor 1
MKGKLVYSTRTGDMRQQPRRSSARAKVLPPNQQTIKLMRDRKGRGGKVVTVATGFALSTDDLTTLAKDLKTLCGAGGTIKQGDDGQVLEIQGDHREKVGEKLTSLGFKVKFAGG